MQIHGFCKQFGWVGSISIQTSVRPYFCRFAWQGSATAVDAKRFKVKPRSVQFAPEMHSFLTTMSTQNENLFACFSALENRGRGVICCVPKLQKDGMTLD